MAPGLALKSSWWSFVHTHSESVRSSPASHCKLSPNFHFQTPADSLLPLNDFAVVRGMLEIHTKQNEASVWRTVGLISHNALSWWDSEEWPAANMSIWAQQTRMCAGCFFLFYLIPFFLKMMALVTFSLPACQLDTAISTPSTPRPSWSVSFISKHHFTHGWL